MLSAVEDMAEESTVEEHESASTKQVLVCFRERKRAVVFPCGANAEAEKDSLLSAIRKEFEDVLGPESDIVLQKKSELWDGEFIDIRDAAPIADHSVVKIVCIFYYMGIACKI